jgi:hypothetical protein
LATVDGVVGSTGVASTDVDSISAGAGFISAGVGFLSAGDGFKGAILPIL